MSYDIYSEVTKRIIAQLEQGVVPWQSPYFSKGGFPTNYSTGKQYQGINVFLLGGLRYASPYFLTYKQAQELGGQVRKGEHGALVIKCGTYQKKDEGGAQGEEASKAHRFLKAYTVFHASQIEGISFPEPVVPQDIPRSILCDRAREIVAGMPNPPHFKEDAAIPCYRPASDCVHMPERRYFHNEEAYFSTLFHELAHSTGHASRLARKSLLESKGISAGGEARKVYAEEELVAEMAASFLNAHAGILEPEIENAAAYLASWIKALKSHDAKTWLIRAASQAQKAAEFILNEAEEPKPA